MQALPDRIERNIALIVVSILLIPSFNFYLNNILLSFGISSMGAVVFFFLLLVEFYGIIQIFKYQLVGKRVALFAIIVLLLALLSYFLYYDELGHRLIREDFHIYYSELLFLFFFGLPALLITSVCRSWDIVIDYAVRIAPVIVFMALYSWWRKGFSTWGDDSMNYMTLSYNVLTAGCICFSHAIKGFRPIYWCASIVFLFIMVAAGCRGALLCSIVFIFVCIYRYVSLSSSKKTQRARRFIGFVLVLTVAVLFVRYYDEIGVLFEQLDIASRTLDKISDNSFFEDSSRDNIRLVLKRGIEENPFGYGLYGDRYVYSKYITEGPEYAHNIIYEFLVDFGIFLGPIFLITLMVLCVKCFYRFKTNVVSLALIILIPDGFIKLFFSNSFLMDTMFFILLGFLFSVRYKKVNFNTRIFVYEKVNSNCCNSL